MAVIAVHDYDFFRYENVIPNLECAKMVTYYRQHNDLALLTPDLEPERYTKFFIRKEYSDGEFPKQLFASNCEYGGRAFTTGQYIQLDQRIERTIPDMHIYDKYAKFFGKTKTAQNSFKRLLNCAHMRLAPDSTHVLSAAALAPYFISKPTGIILHDYDLAALRPYNVLLQLQNSRKYVLRDEIHPYPIGNKYPINVTTEQELRQWMKIVTIPNMFFIEYQGLMSDQLLYDLCYDNKRMARQVYYNVTRGCSDENDFFVHRLPQIFVQTLFLRKAGVKILLNYDENFFIHKELINLIRLFNCLISVQWQENFVARAQSMFAFVRSAMKYHYTNWSFVYITLTVDEIRDSFQYVRENDYELFKKFYEWDSVIYDNGRFISEWQPM